MRCTPVEREHIARAKAEDLYIIQLCITGQYCKSKDGGMAITGAFKKDAAKELRDFIRDWYIRQDKKRKPHRKQR